MGNAKRQAGGIGKPGIEPKKPESDLGVSGVSRGVDRLTDSECRSAKADENIRKLFDGKGLYLAIMPTGSKLWRMKYRHGGKERVYSIGPYSEISLAEARNERKRARDWLRDGKDPTVERRVSQARASAEQAITFRLVAFEWLERQDYSDRHRDAQQTRLDDDLLPHLGALPVASITPPIALECLRKIEKRGALETAQKCRRMLSQIYRYAVQTGRAESDPARDLAGAIRTPKVKHRATIELDDMPTLFAALGEVPAELNTRLALYWLILTATRTGEMRFGTWGEIRADRWRIPAERMKMRLEHIVPLSTQCVTILDSARPLRTDKGDTALLFPGFTRAGVLSENALLALLARAGFYGRQTSHGFRASFSTWAHEIHEADPDVIEACLAHVKDGIRGVYNRATYLSKRAALLQAWADQLEQWGMRLPS